MRDKPLKYKPQGKHCSQCANFQRFTDVEAAWVQQFRKDTAWCNDERWNTINGKAKMKDWQATVRNWQRREKPQKSMPEYANKPIEAASSEDIESVNAMLERMRNGRKNQTC